MWTGEKDVCTLDYRINIPRTQLYSLSDTNVTK